MTTVRVRLQWTLSQLEAAAQHLELALQGTREQDYVPGQIAAIERTIAHNNETRRLIERLREKGD